MSLTSFCRSLSMFVLLCFAHNLVAENHHEKSPAYKVNQLTGNLAMLQGKGGNIAVLFGEQGILMIDDDYKDMSTALVDALKQFGGTNELAYIINTHWHGDHTQGNHALGEFATIVAHDNVRKRLSTEQEVKLFKMKSKPYPETALPSITYRKAMTLHFNDEVIELVHFAGGHTDGDTVVFFKNANVVHAGDHFFNGFFPFVDLDSGGNVITMAENVKMLLSMIEDDTVIIPGHGPLAGKKDLQAFHDMLAGSVAEIKAMKDKDMDLEAIKKQGLTEKWDAWTKGFLSEDVWVGIVYNSL